MVEDSTTNFERPPQTRTTKSLMKRTWLWSRGLTRRYSRSLSDNPLFACKSAEYTLLAVLRPRNLRKISLPDKISQTPDKRDPEGRYHGEDELERRANASEVSELVAAGPIHHQIRLIPDGRQ